MYLEEQLCFDVEYGNTELSDWQESITFYIVSAFLRVLLCLIGAFPIEDV